jgi:hypothetical protein
MKAIKTTGWLTVLAVLLTLASCGPTYVRSDYGPRYGTGYRPYGNYNNGYYGNRYYRRPPIIVAPRPRVYVRPAPRVYERPYSGGRQSYGNNRGNNRGSYRSRGPR